MNSILRDFAYVILWFLVVYSVALVSVEPIKSFIEFDPSRLVFLAIASVALIIFFSTSFASFFRRVWSTYLVAHYKQSLNIINFLIGMLAALLAIQTILPENKSYYLINIVFVFSCFFLSSILFVVLIEGRANKKISQTSKSEDLLNRKKFIKKVLSLLREDIKLVSKSADEALIIWIASRWGSGKSWVLKQIKNDFQKINKSQKVIWFSFNPWLHNAANPEIALVETFFSQLRDEISKQFFLEGLNRHIANYTKSILSQGTKKLLDLDLSSFFSESETTEDLKSHISDFLVRSDIRLIITFDEVDRLTPNEMVTCLRLMRSLGNFANTTMLVCGAPDKVEALLQAAGLQRDYLEKIAHVPLSLPLVGVNTLLDVLWSHLDADNLKAGEVQALVSAFNHLRSNISSGNDQTSLFNNLRVLERLADTIKIDLLDQDKFMELDAFDFINLQLIRLNWFPLYEVIKNNKALFLGTSQLRTLAGSTAYKSKLSEIVDDALVGAGSKGDALVRILEQMFPAYKRGNSAYNYIGSKWRASISEEDSFDRYFVDGLPEGQVSNKVIRDLVNSWKNGVSINLSLGVSGFSVSDIAWIFRELTTTKPVELDSEVKVELAKFLIDKKLDNQQEYKNGSYRADPEDFIFGSIEPYIEIAKYYFSKSYEVNALFFSACDYINGIYWHQRRQGIMGVEASHIEQLLKLAREEFISRTLDEGIDLLSINDKDLHYYWKVLSRDSDDFDRLLSNSISDAIKTDSRAFLRYLYMYREFARDAGHGSNNNYDRLLCFTAENLVLARSYLENGDLSSDEKKELETFITLAISIIARSGGESSIDQ